MYITRVFCEWDMGVNDLFESEDLARSVYEAAFTEQEMDITVEDAEEEGLITFEEVWVEEEDN